MSKVLVLSPYPDKLAKALKDDEIVGPDEEADFIVCFGHRKIITPDIIERFPKRIVNLHIGLLPWNRGADPNFWSWFDGTKKGATIHYIDEGIDTGNIIFQIEIAQFKERPMTLKTTYDELIETVVRMFQWTWPSIKQGRNQAISQRDRPGSYHKLKDKEPFMEKLPDGWDTHVSTVEALGHKYREGIKS